MAEFERRKFLYDDSRSQLLFDSDIGEGVTKSGEFHRRNFKVVTAVMSPDDFLDLQERINPNLDRNNPPFPQKIKHIKSGLRQKKKIPAPVVVFNRDGTLDRNFQEGFHRGVTARNLGRRNMKVFLARKRFGAKSRISTVPDDTFRD